MAANDSDDEKLAVAAKRLGSALGLPGPASIDATRRALAEPEFAQALYTVREMPEIRDQMLAAPDTARVRTADKAQSGAQPPSAARLAAKVAGSVLKWGMEGLKPAQPWVIERRLAACNACEFQQPAPETLIYRGAKIAAGKDSKICARCMCLINTKAAISTEHCPEKDPDDPSLSRWKEPWVESARVEWIWGQ